jgi:hypothetical protein
MTLNSKKVNTNQNLIPNSLTYKYLYQRTILPAVIIVIFIAFASVAIFYGSQTLTEKYNEMAIELENKDLTSDNAMLKDQLNDKEQEKNSLQNTYDNYYNDNPFNVNIDESILVTLNAEIARLEKELKDIIGNNNVVDTTVRYHIEKLLLYIDDIRNSDIIIVSVEDYKSETATGNQHLVYKDDVGNATFSLHGMATSASALSEFLLALNSCEQLKYTNILSIETQSMDDGTSLFVFEVALTPDLTVLTGGSN